MPSFTVNTTKGLYDAVKEKCGANGYKLAFALRTGLKFFLEADHSELVKLAEKYKEK